MYNIGNTSNGFGNYALRYNTGTDSNGIGYTSLMYNIGKTSNGFGNYALRYNTGANNSVLGHNSFANFYADTVNAKLFDATAIDMVAKTITIPNHGFGANGTYTNLRFVQGDSAVTGLSNGAIVQVKIVDANTIAFEEVIQSGQVRTNVNITNAGTGTGHKFEPQKSLSNINILGSNINPTKSNQTIFAGEEAILPQSTVATIDADSTNKALITKEWYNSKTSASLSNYYTKSESVNQFVGLNSMQTIGGTKTFTESPVVPNPTLNTHAVNKGYVDGNFIPNSQKNQPNGVAELDGNLQLHNDRLPNWVRNKYIMLSGEYRDQFISGFRDRNLLIGAFYNASQFDIVLTGSGIVNYNDINGTKKILTNSKSNFISINIFADNSLCSTIACQLFPFEKLLNNVGNTIVIFS
jgi:hypothetical protein